MYYKRCAYGKLSILTFLYCYKLVAWRKDLKARTKTKTLPVFSFPEMHACAALWSIAEKRRTIRARYHETLNTENTNMKFFSFFFSFFFLLIQWATACFPVRIRLGELLCGSQPISRTCVVWSWRLKECFALVASPVNGL